MNTIKPVEELTFTDDFMFGYVLRDPEICKTLLETLLGIQIEHIEYPELQKSFLIHLPMTKKRI